MNGLLMAAVLGLVFAGAVPAAAAGDSAEAHDVQEARDLADTFNYDRFGAVRVYRGRGRPHAVVLLLSGDGGWDAAMSTLAQHLADKGALVGGIDLNHYRGELEKAAGGCVSPASDLENLSHYLQLKFALKKYLPPILAGEGGGATLAYATLAEAPEGLFKGTISLGFSPDLALKKALCDNPAMRTRLKVDAAGNAQGVQVTAASQLAAKWIVLLREPDQAQRDFVAAVPGAELIPLDPSWLSQLDAVMARLSAVHEDDRPSRLPAALADLPLIIVPAPAALPASTALPEAGTGQWFGVFLTGDGGWVGLDKGVSQALAKHDIPVVGWDSLKYFWTRRTPDGAARDLDRVLRYYASAWGRSHALLLGYSQGADTMPFMINRLPAATHKMVGYTTLLGISDNALWEFHVAAWLGKPPKGIPTQPELDRWSGSPYLCIYGESDGDAACEQETGHDGTALKLSGGHHFGGAYDKIAEEILSRLPKLPPAPEQPAALPVATEFPVR